MRSCKAQLPEVDESIVIFWWWIEGTKYTRRQYNV